AALVLVRREELASAPAEEREDVVADPRAPLDRLVVERDGTLRRVYVVLSRHALHGPQVAHVVELLDDLVAARDLLVHDLVEVPVRLVEVRPSRGAVGDGLVDLGERYLRGGVCDALEPDAGALVRDAKLTVYPLHE